MRIKFSKHLQPHDLKNENNVNILPRKSNICAQINGLELENGSGPPEFFSRALSLGNIPADECRDSNIS
jgi:hypothetical protein